MDLILYSINDCKVKKIFSYLEKILFIQPYDYPIIGREGVGIWEIIHSGWIWQI